MNNPWRGLASYIDPLYTTTPYMFCGRDAEIAEVTKIIDNNLFVTLYGRTGIGKTSLLNAGVFPLLRMRNYQPIYIRLSQKPKDYSYAQYIIEVIEKSELKVLHPEEDELSKLSLNNDPEFLLWNYFFTTKFTNSQDNEIYPVIVLDQFEEIFALSNDEPKNLLKQINVLLSDNYAEPDIQGWANDTNYRFVASIREDNLYCLEDAIDGLGLVYLKDNRYRLRPLSQENAMGVVTQPGRECLDSDEARIIAEKAVELSKDNDGAVSSLILSLICSIMFERAKVLNPSTPIIKAAMIPDNQNDTNNILCDFYLQNTTKKQRRIIEKYLLTNDGHRMYSSVSIPDVEKLLANDTRILQQVETAEGTQTEIVHDRMAKVIYMNKSRQDSNKFRNLLRLVIVLFLFIFAGIACVLSWTVSKTSYREYSKEVTFTHSPTLPDQKETIAVYTNCANKRKEFSKDIVRRFEIEANSDIKTIYLGEKVSNIDSLIIKKFDVVIEVSPKNKSFKWDHYWTSSGRRPVGYLYNVNNPTVALYSQNLGYLGKDTYYRLPAGIDQIESNGNVIKHCDSLPRYGVKHAIINCQSALEHFTRDDKIESITITQPVKINSEFFGLTNLRKVVFATDSVHIGRYAFKNCENLTEVRLPRIISGNADRMFTNCYNLTTITLPDTIGKIDYSMFDHCPNIRNISFSDSSHFKFSDDSILLYARKPIYYNLYNNKEWQKSPDYTLFYVDSDSNVNIQYGVIFEVTYRGSRAINIILQRINNCKFWVKTGYGYYYPGIILLNKKIERLYLPLPRLFHGDSKYTITGLTSSIKEIHTPVADPMNFELIVNGNDNVETLYVPYGCAKLYVRSGKYDDYTIKEDPLYRRVVDTIKHHAHGVKAKFNDEPVIFYGLSALGLALLFTIYYWLRKKQLMANGRFEIEKCIGAGLLGVVVAILSFIPVYYTVWVALYYHVNDTHTNPCMWIAIPFGLISSALCSYVFVFAGKGRIRKKWQDKIKRGA